MISAEWLIHSLSCLSIIICSLAADAQDTAHEAGPLDDFTISVNGYQPKQADDYVCVAVPVPQVYVTEFVPTSHADRVHHMILNGCSMPSWPEGTAPGQVWQNCFSHCSGVGHIMYAWARNAPALQLPNDVAYSVGQPNDGVKYVVLQVHYAMKLTGNVSDYTSVTLRMRPQAPVYLASVYLFMGMRSVPAHQKEFTMQETCKYHGHHAIYPFAFRTHTHGLGTVVSAYVLHDKQYTIIGKRNPQWPQMFERINTSLSIEPGDWLTSVCVYNSMDKNHTTHVGATGADEMCNFYMMFYRPFAEPDPFSVNPYCTGDVIESVEGKAVAQNYPEEGKSVMKSRPALEQTAHQSTVQFGYSPQHEQHLIQRSKRRSRRRGGGGARDNSYGADYGDTAYDRDRDYGDPSRNEDRAPKPVAVVSTVDVPDGHVCGTCMVERNCLSQIGAVKFGQIGSVSISPVTGNLLVFHRGDRIWDASTFDYGNRLRTKQAVSVDPVVEIAFDDKNTAKLVTSWGSNLFYMPHGIHVDNSGAVWLTDVAMHQVFKYTTDKAGVMHLSLTLGKAFEPGTDVRSFCKPAAVTTTEDGNVFVADGYCNSRVVKFDAKGQYQSQFGKSYNGQKRPPPLDVFQLPHDISYDKKRSQLYVSDRQNGRVVTYGMDGKAKSELKLPDDFGSVYSASYADDSIFLVPGEPPLSDSTAPVRAFAANADTNHVAYSFTPTSKNLTRPHVIRVDNAGRFIYIGEIEQTGIVWRLEISREQHEYTMHGMHKEHKMGGMASAAAKDTHAHMHMKTEVPSSPDTSRHSPPAAPSVPDQSPLSTTAASSKPVQSSNLASVDGTETGRSGWPSWQLLAVVSVLVLVCVCAVTCCLRARPKSASSRSSFDMTNVFRNASLGRNKLDRNGFKPLRTDDVEGLDSSSDSELEDTLYTNGNKSKKPA